MGGGAATSLGFGSPVMVPQGFGAPASSMLPPATAAAAGTAHLHLHQTKSVLCM